MGGISFSDRVSVPAGVMFRELEGEAVILNVDTEIYYGLDEVGTQMWVALTESATIQAALDSLQARYQVEPGILRNDLDELLTELVDRELVEVRHS